MTNPCPLARVYLAGPDVFYPEPMKAAAEKKKILAGLGMEGVFPLDQIVDPAGLSPEALALRIGQANEAMMRGCDIVIANMEPWHGPSMDVGTAYEMGYGRALGKIVLGYTPDRRRFSERVGAFLGAQGAPWPFQIEDFGAMADNLMMVNAVTDSGGPLEIPATFEEAARLARRLWDERAGRGGV
ncbi:MAG: nucleoside 2-deoxyribosyltransferase [Chthoniobacteraceae bacterium]